MRVLWQKLPDGTFARVSSGVTWVESYDGTIEEALEDGAGSSLPTAGLLSVDPLEDAIEWPEGFYPVAYKKGTPVISLYVAADGNNSNDGLSEDTPLLTLYEACLRKCKYGNDCSIYLGAGEIQIGSPNWNTFDIDRRFGNTVIIGKGKETTTLVGDETVIRCLDSTFLSLQDLTTVSIHAANCSALYLSNVAAKAADASNGVVWADKNSQISIFGACTFEGTSSNNNIIQAVANSSIVIYSAINLIALTAMTRGFNIAENSVLKFSNNSVSQLTFTGSFGTKIRITNNSLVYTNGVALPSPSSVDTNTGAIAV